MSSPGAITVEQYAGIAAALADKLPLADVLANEELLPAKWPEIDTEWKLKLVEDPATFAAYRTKLGEAEDWLGRKVTPIDEDLGAWLAFLGAFAAHKAPFDLLTGMGLGMNDISRLQRRWAKRMADDAELAKKAAELSQKKPDKAPSVSAGSLELKPFPWSKRKGKPPAPAAAEAKIAAEAPPAGEIGLDLVAYAAIAAELSLAPKPRDREMVLRRHDLLAAEHEAERARWEARIAADEELGRDYRRLFAHQKARLEAAARKGEAPREAYVPPPVAAFAPHPDLAPPPPLPAPNKLAGTAMALDVPRGPALPFLEGEAPKEISEGTDEPKRSGSLGGTAMALDIPRGPALPFARNPASAPAPAPSEAAPARPPSKLAGTAMALDVPRGPALPFDPTAAPAPAIAHAAPSEAKPEKPKDRLGGTSLAVDVPRGPALPFARSAPAGAAPKKKKLGELSMGMAIPRNLPPPRQPSAPVPVPVPIPVPIPAPAPLPAPADPPALTLEQHASICVELAMSPERTAEILGRYRITAADKARLDAHYREKVARSAETRAAWDRAYQAYHAWLAGNRPAR